MINCSGTIDQYVLPWFHPHFSTKGTASLDDNGVGRARLRAAPGWSSNGSP